MESKLYALLGAIRAAQEGLVKVRRGVGNQDIKAEFRAIESDLFNAEDKLVDLALDRYDVDLAW